MANPIPVNAAADIAVLMRGDKAEIALLSKRNADRKAKLDLAINAALAKIGAIDNIKANSENEEIVNSCAGRIDQLRVAVGSLEDALKRFSEAFAKVKKDIIELAAAKQALAAEESTREPGDPPLKWPDSKPRRAYWRRLHAERTDAATKD